MLVDSVIRIGVQVKRLVWETPARVALGVGVSVGLGWLSVKGMDWGLAADQFGTFPAVWAFISLLIFICASLIRAYRWHVLFPEREVSFQRLLLVQNAGIGLNNLAPVRWVSEGAQLGLLTLRYKVNGGVALATLAMERVLDMVITSSILMAGLVLLPGAWQFALYVIGAFVFAMGVVLVIPLAVWLGRAKAVDKVPLLRTTANAVEALVRSKRTLLLSSLLTAGHWVVLGLSAWALAYGMGLGISMFVATVAILGTLYFSTALPGLPAAAGTFEFAVVYVLRAFDVPQEQAFSYAIVLHAVVFLPPIVVAVPFFSKIWLSPVRGREADGGAQPTPSLGGTGS